MQLLLNEIRHTPLLWMLVFVPAVLVAETAAPHSHTLLFLLAIVPLAALLSFATEAVATKTGDAVGGPLNATSGNGTDHRDYRTARWPIYAREGIDWLSRADQPHPPLHRSDRRGIDDRAAYIVAAVETGGVPQSNSQESVMTIPVFPYWCGDSLELDSAKPITGVMYIDGGYHNTD